MSNGVEIVGVVIVFFFIGFGLDRLLDTAPWFTVGMTVFGIVGTFVRAWYAYDAEMRYHEEVRRAATTAASPVTSPTEPAP